MTVLDIPSAAPHLPYRANVRASGEGLQFTFLAEGFQHAEQRALAIAEIERGLSAVVGKRIFAIWELELCSWDDFYQNNPSVKPGWRLPDPCPGFTTPCVLTFDNDQIALDWTRYDGDFAANCDVLGRYSDIEWPFIPIMSPPRHMPTEAEWLRIGIKSV